MAQVIPSPYIVMELIEGMDLHVVGVAVLFRLKVVLRLQ